MRNSADWCYFGTIMDCPTKRSWQTKNAGRPYCQLDYGMVNYLMAVVPVLGSKKITLYA